LLSEHYWIFGRFEKSKVILTNFFYDQRKRVLFSAARALLFVTGGGFILGNVCQIYGFFSEK